MLAVVFAKKRADVEIEATGFVAVGILHGYEFVAGFVEEMVFTIYPI